MLSARPARRLIGGAALAALAAGLLLAPAPNGADVAQARPQHMKFFANKYSATLDADEIKNVKCSICHEKTQKEKKFRNPYGIALAEVVAENEKDETAFAAALDKVAAMSSCVPDKTYGDLIKDGKLPSESCPPVTEKEAPIVPTPAAD